VNSSKSVRYHLTKDDSTPIRQRGANRDISARCTMETHDHVAAMFKALGDPTRLKIFEYLQSCNGPVAIDDAGVVRKMSGPTVGEICCHINANELSVSTISFHLKELRMAGVIVMQKHGKNILYSINSDSPASLISFLTGRTIRADAVDCCNDRTYEAHPSQI
jgi:ArsR family transcriptional regulator